MYRTKDFDLMDVINIHGKKLGIIKDVIIDFYNKKVIGFLINTSGIFSNKSYVFIKDIITFDEIMIVERITQGNFLEFNSIRNMDIMDTNGVIIGVFEDIVFTKRDFEIKAVIASGGFIRNLISGKKVMLTNQLIIGEKNVLCFSSAANSKINFSNKMHRIKLKNDAYEKES